MATVLVKYKLPNIPPRDVVMGLFEKSATEIFKDMEGLYSKQFCYDEKTGEGLSVYHWASREHAEGFFTPEFIANFKVKFGADPHHEIYDTYLMLDNRAGDMVVHK